MGLGAFPVFTGGRGGGFGEDDAEMTGVGAGPLGAAGVAEPGCVGGAAAVAGVAPAASSAQSTASSVATRLRWPAAIPG